MTVHTQLCRVTIMAPAKWAEVALPTDVPLLELLPSLVRHVDDDELSGDDVVLQRLGDPPLDAEQSLTQLAVHDGETLYVRLATAPVPQIDFDDLIDGVATGVRQRADRWSARFGRRVLLGLAFVPVALSLSSAVLPGAPGPRAAAALCAAVLLVAAAGAAARAAGDAAAALVCGLCAYATAVAASAVFVGSGPGGLHPSPTTAAAVAGVLAAVALALLALTGAHTAVHAPVALAGVLGLAVALTAGAVGWSRAPAAALLLAVVTLTTPVLPVLAYRCASIAPPLLPTGADDLETTSQPLPGAELVARAARADAVLTGLTVATSVLSVLGVLLSVPTRGWQGVALLAVVGLLAAVRTRVMASTSQRCALLGVTVAAGACLYLQWAVGASADARAVSVLASVPVAATVLVASARLPGRRLSPYWGRGADLSESLLALCVLPFAVWVTGLFTAARALGG